MRSQASLVGPTTARPSWAERARARLNRTLAPAGLALDGPHPWDPQIRRSRAVVRVLLGGTLGAGRAYVDGDWDCAALDELTARLLAVNADHAMAWRSPVARADDLAARFANGQTRRRARRGVVAHYDRDPGLYAAMLGPTMTYSCGYWRDATSLDDAQRAKHTLICDKLQLRPGMRVLDIGCGWGGFAAHAARVCGVEVTGTTISPAQAVVARERCAGLPVTILERDYRDLAGQFDRVVSVGMFEHVGPPNYRTYFEAARQLLAPGGLFLLHTIGGSRSVRTSDPWIARYVFPGTVLPSAAQITAAIEGLFVLEDWHSFGADYDRTLVAWHHNLERAWSETALGDRHDERSRRLWRYYLLTCAGAFRARRNQVWQLVLSPGGVPGGYRDPADACGARPTLGRATPPDHAHCVSTRAPGESDSPG